MMLLVFFAPIKNPKLKTGFEVKLRKAKLTNQLKKGKQAFISTKRNMTRRGI